jgi:hypothetical protein
VSWLATEHSLCRQHLQAIKDGEHAMSRSFTREVLNLLTQAAEKGNLLRLRGFFVPVGGHAAGRRYA